MLGVLCGCFQGGFNFGSPEAFFEVSLLWTSAYDARRISGPADKTQRLFQLPSWSWAGWGGAVGMSMCLHTSSYLHSSWKEHFHRFQDYECVSWYHSTKSGCIQKAVFQSATHSTNGKAFQRIHQQKSQAGGTEVRQTVLAGDGTPRHGRPREKPIIDDPLSYVFSAWNSLGLHLSQHGAFSQGRE